MTHGRPAHSDRPEVHSIANYLRERPNQEIPRRVVGRTVGVSSQNMSSVLTTVSELYPQIGESDDNKLVWVDYALS